MADGLARGKRLAGCSALHGVQGILCPVASPSGFRAHVCGGSGLPRGQKQDPPSFVKASAESWYRVPPLPRPFLLLEAEGVKWREGLGTEGTVHCRAVLATVRRSARLAFPGGRFFSGWCIAMWIINHWTTREVPVDCLFAEWIYVCNDHCFFFLPLKNVLFLWLP